MARAVRVWRPAGVLDWLARLILVVPLGLALVALSGIGHRWFDILAQFTAPALIATAVLTLLLAVTRLTGAATHGAVACLALLLAVSPQWFPGGPKPTTDTPIVRLYSANLYYLNGDVASIRRSIVEADADVVVLIELGRDAAGRIDEVLEGYPYRAASMRMDQTRGPSRSVIGSRYPLTVLDDPPDGLHAVAAVATTPLGRLNVVGVHLTRPWPFQEQWGQISQTMALQEVVEGMTGPVVVAGDFNSVSSARIGKQMRRDLGLYPAPGFPGTWPSNLPAALGMTIDQVYASPELGFVARRLARPTGSDHRPVVTEFTRAAN
ncbi:endonuclease/exonuclease/phosphatase (EEP) superfamily protein YafD [Brevundimonas alba]|uniref:Endonuclease/exonuclease/phosphatase (EEP) superfamily protein YafD n=1 Tax=Brevundimonas alba TaxID=74314 RepID=A0A7X5YHS0_9CAUL|nr:endonuclease/exonuclease/phosphatase family protein [Brevundimonas alba]NJC39988.1 endonuclease/exonuclease/phosphatase (EEP) superfamily protein YafD [Brevundimonas alba]